MQEQSYRKNTFTLFFIIDILRKHSDEEHPLSVEAIGEYLESFDNDYNHFVSTRTLQRTLNDLKECPIEEFKVHSCKINGSTVIDKNGHEKTVSCNGYYLVKALNDTEYHLLVDSIIFSKYIDSHQVEKITDILSPLTSVDAGHYKPIVRKNSSPYFRGQNNYTKHIEILSRAIREHLKVNLVMGDYTFAKGSPLVYPECEISVGPFSPISLVLCGGEYYVLGCYERDFDRDLGRNFDGDFDGDSIKNFDVNSSSVKSFKVSRIYSLTLLSNNHSNLDKFISTDQYLATHPKMLDGTATRITLLVKADRADLIAENFGNDFRVNWNAVDQYSLDEDYVEVHLAANPEDVFRLALEHAKDIEIISPKALRRRISDVSKSLQKRYNRSNEDRYREAIRSLDTTEDFLQITGNEEADKLRARLHNRVISFREKRLDLAGIDLNGHNEFKDLTHKEMIKIGDNGLKDYSFLRDFKNLKSLVWCGSLPEDISWLESLDSLNGFFMENACNNRKDKIIIPDFTIFNNITNLEYIGINADNFEFENLTSILTINSATLKEILFQKKRAWTDEELLTFKKFKDQNPGIALKYKI